MREIGNCNNCKFLTTDGLPMGNSIYCKYCAEAIKNEAINKNIKRNLETRKSEEIIEKLKKDFQIERESFEEALLKAEEWHKAKLAEQRIVDIQQLAIKDQKIAELESLLKDKEIANLKKKIELLEEKFTQLETKYSELIINEN